MLAQVDRVVAVIVWIVAALAVLMLFIGPQVVAEDKPQEAQATRTTADDEGGGGGGEEGADGRQVFTDNCGTCHTLSAAGTNGQTGPELDGIGLDAAAIAGIVRSGAGGMPAFEGRLSDGEIEAVAAFVADQR